MTDRQSPLRLAQVVWRNALPTSVRWSLGPKLEHAVRRLVLGDNKLISPRSIDPGPLIVSTYGDKTFGIGRAGRLTFEALTAAGFDPVDHDIRPILAAKNINTERLVPNRTGGVWLMHCNPGDAALALSNVRRVDWEQRYRIGYWAWELPRAPRFWLWMTHFFHEVWVPSAYVANAFSGSAAPIRVIPHSVRIEPPRGRTAGPLRVLAMADLRSSLERKNPLGAIEAFKRARPHAQQDCTLLLKLHGADFDAEGMTLLQTAAASRSDIVIIEQVLREGEMNQLRASADVLLSLHRAEGFGLPIAEAMARATPAVATAWSGNLDYMTGLDDLLVRCKMIAVRDSSGVYRDPRAQWADPDLDDAARKLRALLDGAPYRARLGEEAQSRIAALARSWTAEALDAQPWRPLITTRA